LSLCLGSPPFLAEFQLSRLRKTSGEEQMNMVANEFVCEAKIPDFLER
jgi:hypothetical protein